MPLIVLDRDGVINEDSPDYIRGLTDWRPIPGSLAAIAALSKAGYSVAIATNQSGLGRGYFGLEELEAIHARLCQQVEEAGGVISGIFYCPHLPGESCDCRKPATGMLTAIETELGLSARGEIFVGDSVKDLQTALAFGCRPILVKTGQGAATLNALLSNKTGIAEPDKIPVYDDLAAATHAILRDLPAPKGDR